MPQAFRRFLGAREPASQHETLFPEIALNNSCAYLSTIAVGPKFGEDHAGTPSEREHRYEAVCVWVETPPRDFSYFQCASPHCVSTTSLTLVCSSLLRCSPRTVRTRSEPDHGDGLCHNARARKNGGHEARHQTVSKVHGGIQFRLCTRTPARHIFQAVTARW